MGGKRISLAVKFVLIIVLFLVLIFSAFSYSLVTFNISSLNRGLENEIKSFTQLATPPIGDNYLEYKDSGGIRITQFVQKYADLEENVTNFSIVDTEGKVVYSYNEVPTESVTAEQAASFEPIYTYRGEETIERAIVPYFEESGVHRYSVVFDVSNSSIQDVISRQVSIIIVFTVVGMLISILVMYWVVDYNFIQPMKSLSQQALAISAGNIGMQIESKRRDEVDDLAKSVNTMASKLRADIEKLEQLDKMKNEFLTIVSHNLRTPLTIIRGYLDAANQVQNVEDMHKIVEKVKYGSLQLSMLAEDMITISELESGQSIGNRKPLSVPQFVRDAADDFESRIKDQGIKFVVDIQDGEYEFSVNESLLKGVIWALLDNAQKFTKEGGKITLSAKTTDNKVEISVSDTGIGIAEEEIPKLFTKFHRGTSLETYDYEGTGIGLYSGSLVMKEHGGEINVESKLGEGSKFTITMPLSKT